MVYGKHHVLCQETEPLEKIVLIKSGWVRRVRGVPLDPASTGVAVGMGQTIGVDFLGAGNCLGLEGFGGTKPGSTARQQWRAQKCLRFLSHR